MVDPETGGDIVVEPLNTKEVMVYLERDELTEVGITTVDEINNITSPEQVTSFTDNEEALKNRQSIT